MRIQPQSLPSAYPAVLPVLEQLGLREAVSAVIAKQWHNGVDHADVVMVLLLMILDEGGSGGGILSAPQERVGD